MANIDGNWNVTVQTPMGPQTAVMTVVTDGATFTGGFNGEMGEVTMENGTVDGDNLSWKMTVTKPMTVEVTGTATIDGDALEGKVDTGMMGAFGLTGTRA